MLNSVEQLETSKGCHSWRLFDSFSSESRYVCLITYFYVNQNVFSFFSFNFSAKTFVLLMLVLVRLLFFVFVPNVDCQVFSSVPMPRSTGEPKTKPTQASVRELRGLGLSPDLIVVRSERAIGMEVKEKISNFCHVAPEQVICVHDLSSIYHVPLLMDGAGVVKFLTERLQLNLPTTKPDKSLYRWR